MFGGRFPPPFGPSSSGGPFRYVLCALRRAGSTALSRVVCIRANASSWAVHPCAAHHQSTASQHRRVPTGCRRVELLPPPPGSMTARSRGCSRPVVGWSSRRFSTADDGQSPLRSADGATIRHNTVVVCCTCARKLRKFAI